MSPQALDQSVQEGDDPQAESPVIRSCLQGDIGVSNLGKNT